VPLIDGETESAPTTTFLKPTLEPKE